MTDPLSSDLKLTDRQLLRMILAAQRDMAGILLSMAAQPFPARAAINKAETLERNLTELLRGIPR